MMNSPQDPSRIIRRLASLYNDVAMLQLRAPCFTTCASIGLNYNNKIEIWAQQCQQPSSRLAELAKTLAFLSVVDGYLYSASFERRIIFPARPTCVLYEKIGCCPATEKAKIAETLPEEMRKQAVAVENCVGANTSLSPALAWLTRGVPTTVR